MSTHKPLLTLITGANQGLGYYTARHLARSGKHKVLVGSRSIVKANDAIQKMLGEDDTISASLLEAIEIDLSRDISITTAANHLEATYGYLDILINNAAISGAEYNLDVTPRNRFNAIYDTNVAGTAVVTETFIRLLKKSTASAPGRRIVFVSSSLGSLTLASTGHLRQQYAGYAISKAALNMLTLYHVSGLRDDKITVVATTPGFCATNLNNYGGTKPPEDGALEIVAAATEGGFEMTGKFVEGGQIVPW
jgi:NAD(P)-dependent dehydrogenase (short-subunit alcohol dehydrogenase family)